MIRKVFFLLFVIMMTACSSNSIAEEKTDQLQLQESLQRFYTRFTERTLESLLKTGLDKKVETRELAVRQYTLYDSEVLKIATGPFPEVNLLDMLVFIKLNKMTVESYWIPNVWKESGKLLLKSFKDSEQDIDQIARNVLTEAQMNKVNQGIIDWKNKNPNIYRVEKIRLDEVARAIPQLNVGQEKDGGFLNLKGAVKAVDQMVLVANRGIFVAQYMPALMRLQARIATSEIMDDVSIKFGQKHVAQRVNRSIASISNITPMLDSAVNLTNDMKDITKDTHEILNSYHKIFPDGVNATENLKTIESIVEGTNILFEEMKNSKANNVNVVSEFKSEFRNLAIFIASLALGVGALLSVIFWACYYFFQKLKMKQMRVTI